MKFKLRYLIAGAILFLVAVVMYPDGSCRIVKKAEGQEKPRNEWMESGEVDWQTEYIVIGLIKVYGIYEAECYADSVTDYFLKWDNKTALFGVDSSKFAHRPPTLPGFMQFLEEKYKQ